MDHYQTLGVSRNATPDEIKKAYRKLASQHHPDKGGDTHKFQEIQTAYDILSDPNKKQQYDNPNPFGQGQEFPGGFQFHFNGDNIHDIFSQMFGGRPNPFSNQNSGRQLYRTKVTVSLEDAYTGAKHTLKMHTHEGLKVISIDVPKGVQTGSQLRYENVLTSGSLIVEFVVMPHLKFDRKGHDLFTNQTISVLDLIVGTKIQFTTLSGKTLDVTVRPNTQPYMQLRIPNEGMPNGQGGYGDQILLLKPFIPDNISSDIIESINKFKAK
jgi:curved DNA-binding protein